MPPDTDFSAFSRRRWARSRSCSPKMIAIGFKLIFVKRRLPFSFSITPSTATSIPWKSSFEALGHASECRDITAGDSCQQKVFRCPETGLAAELGWSGEIDESRSAVLQFDETAIMSDATARWRGSCILFPCWSPFYQG